MLSERTRIRAMASGLASCSQDITLPRSGSARSVPISPTLPRSRRATNATTALLDGSSHCRSSMPTMTGASVASAAMADNSAAATTC